MAYVRLKQKHSDRRRKNVHVIGRFCLSGAAFCAFLVVVLLSFPCLSLRKSVCRKVAKTESSSPQSRLSLLENGFHRGERERSVCVCVRERESAGNTNRPMKVVWWGAVVFLPPPPRCENKGERSLTYTRTGRQTICRNSSYIILAACCFACVTLVCLFYPLSPSSLLSLSSSLSSLSLLSPLSNDLRAHATILNRHHYSESPLRGRERLEITLSVRLHSIFCMHNALRT